MDIQFAIDELQINEDILVVAGDNVLDFSLAKIIAYAKKKKTSCTMRYYEPSIEKLQKCGVISFDDNDKITLMTEKSPTPATNWVCPAFYYYTKDDAKFIKNAISDGCGTDAPGSFIAWLCQRTAVHAMEMLGKRYDIGSLESYKAVKKEYRGIIK